MTNDIIDVQQLSFAYDHQEVLKALTTSFPAGSVALLTGPSGCGKSTLLRLIAGLLPKYGGHLTNGRINFPAGKPTIGMLFQDPLMQFALDTPRHELEFVLENERVPHEQIAARVTAALHFCKITDLADRQLTTLSGGQQQRVALAVTIARQAKVLLLDEPFASIDEESRHFLIGQLQQLVVNQGITILIADHDCHGYQKLHPLVYQFQAGTVARQSAVTSAQLLAAADERAKQPLRTARPTASAPTAFQLTAVRIERGERQLLSLPQLALFRDKITLVTGANGSGKSTFFQALAKLIPYQGQIDFAGHDIQQIKNRRYRADLGLVFQHADDQFINVTVAEELALSKRNGRHPYFQTSLPAALELLGLTGLDERVVYSLSGGQRKKLQLLLMLMMSQPVLLLDEPFAGLDRQSLQNVYQLIKTAQATKPQTMLIISHQLAAIDQLIDFHLHLSGHQLRYEEDYHES